MANTRIGRNVETTKCKGEYYDANFKKWPFEVKVYGRYTITKLARKVRNILKTDNFMIDPDSVEYESFWASMPIEQFVELADKTEH